MIIVSLLTRMPTTPLDQERTDALGLSENGRRIVSHPDDGLKAFVETDRLIRTAPV